MSVRAGLIIVLLLGALGAQADERVMVCFNYGCYAQAEVVYDELQLRELGRIFAPVRDAQQERDAMAIAIGRLLGWAGRQSPIFADRGGNYADDGVYGRMDCIDHAQTTTRLLQLIDAQGLLHYHRVLEPQWRWRRLILTHYSAVVEEIDVPAQAGRYVVDSWFFDNGESAAVIPLARWQAGESPNGNE